MRTWITTENEIPFMSDGDCTEKIIELISNMSDGDELIFSKGTYYLKGRIDIKGRKGLKFIGYGVTIITDFDPCHPNDCTNAFELIDCDDIDFLGFTFTTNNPTNIVGRIINKNKEEGFFDVALPEHSPLVGNEWIEGLDTFNEDYSHNFHIFWADYGKPHRWYKIDRNVVRFLVWPSRRERLDMVSMGELICMRFSLYAPGTFSFIGCNRILLEDITVESCPGESCVVHPRSSNFTFRRYNIKLARDSKQGYACNTDGLHFTGITGKVIMEDCHFEYMGDDSLNMHCHCGNVYSFDGKNLKSGCLKRGYTYDDPPKESLSPRYAQKGDIIYIYDPKTTKLKAQMTVDEYTQNNFVVSNVEGEIEQGDVVVNSALYPELHIINCSVSRSRARGFLVKTNNVVIENCYFEKLSEAGVIASCGIGEWHEMGPVHNMVIKNCVFEDCGTTSFLGRADGIVVGGGPGSPRQFKLEDVGVFSNIKVIGNRFTNLKDPAIFAVGVDGLEIKDNYMFNCANTVYPDSHIRFSYNMVAHNCDNIVCENNISVLNKNEFLNEKPE